MVWISLTIVFFIIGTIGFIVGKMSSPMDEHGEAGGGKVGGYGVLGACVLGFVILTLVSSINIIDAGHVGVVKTFGSIDSQIGDGPALVAPWSDVIEVSTKAEKKEFDHLGAASQETQDVFVDVTLNLAVAPGYVQCLYRTVGSDWYDKLVPSRLLQTLKDETVKYSTVDVLPNREVIRAHVRDRLKLQLTDFSIRKDECKISIDVQDVLLRNIDFQPEFKKAIEEKQIATQNAEAAKNRVRQAEFEAQQAVKKAEGEAQSTFVKAEGEAKATFVKAQAQARANRLLAQSLTPEVISFAYVQKLAAGVRWIVTADGKVAVPPGALAPSGK